jgi:hypothetical protein
MLRRPINPYLRVLLTDLLLPEGNRSPQKANAAAKTPRDVTQCSIIGMRVED